MPLYIFKIYYFDRCSKILYYILRHKKCLNVEAWSDITIKIFDTTFMQNMCTGN